MDQLVSFNRKALLLMIGGTCIYILLTVPFLHNMPITTDEVQFAEPAYNFIKNGHFGTTSLSGIFGFAQKTYWQHPLYLALMYFPIRIFGYSFWAIKIMSVIIGLIALIYAHKTGKLLGIPYLYPAMLTFNVLFVFLAKIGRMEILTMCLSLAAFYYAMQKKDLPAGVMSSLALLTHPIGLFTVLNTFVVFWCHRRFDFRYAAGLVFPLALAFSFVLFDLREFTNQYFIVQKYLYDARGLLSGPETQLQNFLILMDRAGLWLKLQVPVLILFIWGLCRKKNDLSVILILITVINFLGLVLFVPNKYINYYSAIVLPYMLLYVALAVSRHRSIPVIALLVVSLASNGVMSGMAAASFHHEPTDLFAISRLLPPGSRILGPPELGVPLQTGEVIGFHVVRMKMDLENKTMEEVLAELEPDYLAIEPASTVGQSWRLFTRSEDEFIAFLQKRTVYRGKAWFNGRDIYVFKLK